MRTTRRLAVAMFLAALMLLASPAFAQVTADDVVAGLDGGVYLQPGAESVDRDRLASVIADAASDAEIDLTVIVLADSVDAVALAQNVNNRVTGTVLVFTPDAYGAASTDLGQGRMDEALSGAEDALSGADIVEGVAAFVSSATPSSTNWGLLIGAGLLILVVVGVGGRMVERKATSGRRAAALAKRWSELQTQADAMSDPIIELSTRVDIDGRPAITARYRAAAAQYDELTSELGRMPTADRVDAIDRGLAELEEELAALRTDVRSPT